MRCDAVLIVVARYLVEAGEETTVVELLRRNAAASREESGCLEFAVLQDVDDPRRILLYERYADEHAFQAHRQTPHFHELVEGQVGPRLAERTWTRMEPLPD